ALASTPRAGRGPAPTSELEPAERREGLAGLAVDDERVDDRRFVFIAEANAADELIFGRDAEHLHDGLRIFDPGCLGAGMQALAAGGQHHALDEHAHVEPTATLEIAVKREEKPH